VFSLTVYLVPAARGRFELYSESPEGERPDNGTDDRGVESGGRLRGWVFAASRHWREWVERARQERDQGLLARLRDRCVRALAESIAEQRTLWALRNAQTASVRFPATLGTPQAEAVVRGALIYARRHHLRWGLVHLLLFVCSGVLMPIPGPNIAAFYFAFRLVGHWQSWRGARQGLEVTSWRYDADQCLAELAGLVDVPREVRAARVEAIAERLHLEKLSAFFDRVAVPSA